MKHVFLTLLFFAASLLFALPTIDEIRGYGEDAAEELVYSTGFEDSNAPEFRIAHPEVSFVRGAGSTGNTGLRVSGGSNAMLCIDLKGDICRAGNKYRVKVLVRGKTGSTDGKKHGSYRFMSVNCRDSATDAELPWRQYGVFPFTDYLDDPDDINAFHDFTFEFYGHPNAYPFLQLMVGGGGPFQGTVIYDDLRVYQCGVDAHINLVTPAMQAFKRGGTAFSFYGICQGRAELCMLVELEQNGVVCYEEVLAQDDEGFFCGNVPGGLAPGEYLLRTTLVDPQARKRLKTAEFPVTIRPEDESPPVGAVSFDENRRILVDGKPFFGVSLGCSSAWGNDHLKQHADMGFNVVDTGPYNLVVYNTPDFATQLLAKLDFLQSVGLKVRLSLIDFYSRPQLCQAFGGGAEGAAKLVALVKDHPAILGYYLLDELTEKDWPKVTEIRNTANRVDPYHPCYICTNLLATTPKIAVTTDVIGYDFYPIGLKDKPAEDIDNVDKMARQTRDTGLPFWAVPQAFCWGLYQADITPEKFRRYQEPTANQMFADGILFALNGVTDFWFFTCPIRGDHIKIAEEVGDPGYCERSFRASGVMARHLQRLGEYLLATPVPEDLPFQNLGQSGIRVKRYRNDAGRSAIVIFAEGQGPAKALVTLPADINWTSDFGLATQRADGVWIFQADGFAADVLYEE